MFRVDNDERLCLWKDSWRININCERGHFCIYWQLLQSYYDFLVNDYNSVGYLIVAQRWGNILCVCNISCICLNRMSFQFCTIVILKVVTSSTRIFLLLLQNKTVSVFETTIRVLGGLLSAHLIASDYTTVLIFLFHNFISVVLQLQSFKFWGIAKLRFYRHSQFESCFHHSCMETAEWGHAYELFFEYFFSFWNQAIFRNNDNRFVKVYVIVYLKIITHNLVIFKYRTYPFFLRN